MNHGRLGWAGGTGGTSWEGRGGRVQLIAAAGKGWERKGKGAYLLHCRPAVQRRNTHVAKQSALIKKNCEQ